MSTYIVVFLFELLTAYILWFALRKIFKTTKLYRIALVCLVASLAVGYTASYRIVEYQVTMDYLTEINNYKIELTGESITLEEENVYKEELFQREDFKNYITSSSIELSLYPFIVVIFIMLFFARRAIKKLEECQVAAPVVEVRRRMK